MYSDNIEIMNIHEHTGTYVYKVSTCWRCEHTCYRCEFPRKGVKILKRCENSLKGVNFLERCENSDHEL